MTSRRVTLYGILLFISIITSLLFTYVYGSFQHERYWEGTIRNVIDTEINLIKGIASIVTENDLTNIDNDYYKALFDSLTGKVGVSVVSNNELVYSNIVNNRAFDDEPISIENNTGLVFKLYRYASPAWGFNFKRWLTSIDKWFTPRFDYITVPFLFSLIINYLFLYALLWRYREKHMSMDVRQLLNKLGT